jgi:hypothetical protein
MIGPADEMVRPATGAGFSDGVEVAFGDAEAGIFVTARIGVIPGAPGTAAGGPATATALVVIFADRAPIEIHAQGGIEVADPDWTGIEVAGLRFETLKPLTSWRASFSGGRGGFDVVLDAVSAPCEAGAESEVARGGGLQGYEQLCRVTGTATVDGRTHDIECLGQRGHSWGVADWTRIESARSIGAWLDDAHAVALSAVRPAGAAGHGEEATTAWLVADGEERAAVLELEDPRLSTGYDAEGRQRRATLELWESEDSEMPHRASGQLLCGTTLDLGTLRMDCAFFAWRMEGRAGVGRYDLIRRA